MLETGTTSMGFSKKLVNIFIFFGAEDCDETDAFLFFTAARSAALVFFASDAEGRTGLGVGAGGAEEIGSITSGTTVSVCLVGSDSSGSAVDASACLACSLGATLVVALAIPLVDGCSHQPWYSHFLQQPDFHQWYWHVLQSAE